MDTLERAADAKGKILRVERIDGGPAPGTLLTFDVGRVLVTLDATGGRLASRHVEASEELAGDAIDLAQEEPWWRVVGNPIVRVSADDGRGEWRLQFREDDQNPKIIVLRHEAGGLRAFELPGVAGS